VHHRLVDVPGFLNHDRNRAARLGWGARGAWAGRAGSTLLAPVARKLQHLPPKDPHRRRLSHGCAREDLRQTLTLQDTQATRQRWQRGVSEGERERDTHTHRERERERARARERAEPPREARTTIQTHASSTAAISALPSIGACSIVLRHAVQSMASPALLAASPAFCSAHSALPRGCSPSRCQRSSSLSSALSLTWLPLPAAFAALDVRRPRGGAGAAAAIAA
jgi:hypothetical protein